MKIIVTGAAGLVGQNLIPRLKARRDYNIVAIDKHERNAAILRQLHPDIEVLLCDLATDDGWERSLADADVVIMAHAQIGGLDRNSFVANNITATERLIGAIGQRRPFVIHISSSVVNSAAEDWYTETKEAQEQLVRKSGLPVVVLRPTLMFGWFDRKHLGWLSRFMSRHSLFPVPGHGRYLRQPLYAGDFCDIVMSCIESRPTGKEYNISGLERIDYIDLMRAVRDACGAKARVVRIPYRLFWGLLYVYALFDRNPPFTTRQLEALVTPDIFDVIDWPEIFRVRATPLRDALSVTFRDPAYSNIILEF
jgi:nucleoside-diphosphate-sugar epimerase